MLDYGATLASVDFVSELALYYRPPTRRTDRRLVFFSHGRGGDAVQAMASGSSADPGGLYRVIRELVRRDYVVASFTWAGSTHWGKPAARNRIPANLLGAVAVELGVDTDVVAWLAYSMGYVLPGASALPTVGVLPAVAAVVGVAPATNVDELYARGAPWSTEIDAAFATWGTAGGDAFDPIDSTAALAGVPVQLWSGAADVTIPPGDVLGGVARYAGALAAVTDVELRAVAGDHGTVWQAVDPVAVADHIDGGVWT